GEIELRHVGTGTVAGVGHGEAGGDGVAAFDGEIAVVEARVAQAVPERVEGLRARLREPAIAHLPAFVVFDRDRRAHGVPRPGSSGRGVCARLSGKVMGSRPEGFTLPDSTSAMACAPS